MATYASDNTDKKAAGSLYLASLQLLAGYQTDQALGLQNSYQSTMANLNAGRLDLMANDMQNAYNDQSNTIRNANKTNTASLRASAGSSLVDPNSGTARGVKDSVDLYSKLDESTIRANAFKAAFGVEASRRDAEFQNKARDNQSNLVRKQTLISAGVNAYSAYKYR